MKKRRAQIICTIGPACRSPEKIEALIAAGMDVARLHFSYSDHREHAENIRRIRQAAKKLKRRVYILQDLTGTKVRLGDFHRKWVALKKGATFTLSAVPLKGDATIASVNIPELISVIKRGDTVLLADGALQLKAIAPNPTEVRCQVIVGGRIKSQQAVHVPGKAAPVCVPTIKDLEDVRFALQHKMDWIAQSYATTAQEIHALRAFMKREGSVAPIVTKIERRAALKNVAQMVRAADMVMVARGDLALETPLEKIALEQKQIIRCANRAGKPVITATEMLLSMMENDRPTRAEVADVTNAILDGSDALMLSGETSMGHYPVEATRMLARIAAAVADSALAPGKKSS